MYLRTSLAISLSYPGPLGDVWARLVIVYLHEAGPMHTIAVIPASSRKRLVHHQSRKR